MIYTYINTMKCLAIWGFILISVRMCPERDFELNSKSVHTQVNEITVWTM